MKRYKVLEDGFLAGNHHKAGDVVSLLDAQAVYFLPPYAKRLEPVVDQVAPVSSPPATPAPRKPRRKG